MFPCEPVGAHVRVDVLGRLRGYFGFSATIVVRPVENGAGQVRVFYRVQIGDEDVADAEECEILDDLVAECAGTDDHHFCGRQLLLVPPRYQAEPGKAVIGFLRR